MKRPQRVVQEEYTKRKLAQLLLSSLTFENFIKVYRLEVRSLEPVSLPKVTKSSKLFPSFVIWNRTNRSPKSTIEHSLFDESSRYLQELERFMPKGVDSSHLENLAKNQTDLAQELYPSGTAYWDYGHIGYGIFGVALLGLSRLLLNKVGLKIVAPLFLAGTALCCYAFLACFRSRNITYNLDQQAEMKFMEIDNEVSQSLMKINKQQGASDSAMMQEVDQEVTIQNVELCKEIYFPSLRFKPPTFSR